jgi:hypothetical protein
MFNAIINCNGLREIYLSGGQYTWSNNQQDPTLEKLDRFLMNDSWECLFPLATVHKLVKEMSDHNPLILDTMEQKNKVNRDFKFEKAWLHEDDFLSRVSRSWSIPRRAADSLGKLQHKLKNVKKDLKGWGANLKGRDIKRKKRDQQRTGRIRESGRRSTSVCHSNKEKNTVTARTSFYS